MRWARHVRATKIAPVVRARTHHGEHDLPTLAVMCIRGARRDTEPESSARDDLQQPMHGMLCVVGMLQSVHPLCGSGVGMGAVHRPLCPTCHIDTCSQLVLLRAPWEYLEVVTGEDGAVDDVLHGEEEGAEDEGRGQQARIAPNSAPLMHRVLPDQRVCLPAEGGALYMRTVCAGQQTCAKVIPSRLLDKIRSIAGVTANNMYAIGTALTIAAAVQRLSSESDL
jgi:hypothetical protein